LYSARTVMSSLVEFPRQPRQIYFHVRYPASSNLSF